MCLLLGPGAHHYFILLFAKEEEEKVGITRTFGYELGEEKEKDGRVFSLEWNVRRLCSLHFAHGRSLSAFFFFSRRINKESFYAPLWSFLCMAPLIQPDTRKKRCIV